MDTQSKTLELYNSFNVGDKIEIGIAIAINTQDGLERVLNQFRVKCAISAIVFTEEQDPFVNQEIKIFSQGLKLCNTFDYEINPVFGVLGAIYLYCDHDRKIYARFFGMNNNTVTSYVTYFAHNGKVLLSGQLKKQKMKKQKS